MATVVAAPISSPVGGRSTVMNPSGARPASSSGPAIAPSTCISESSSDANVCTTPLASTVWMNALDMRTRRLENLAAPRSTPAMS